MPIKAIYFDLGGVIVRTEDKTLRTELGQRFGMTYDQIDRFVFGCETAKKASIGLISEEQHWRDVARRLEQPESDWQSIADAFFGGDKIDRDMLAFIESVRPAIKTGVISNAWNGLRDYMRKNGFLAPFDDVIVSAEVGIVKPDARIYQLALDKFGIQPEEAVFVDDMPENIAACQALGMQGVQFKTAEQVLADVKQLLVIGHRS
ncbi:MAG: HAD family phosphatase [Chloroflexi bacterium]|nr:HAD family phosphatase [Chloroflexota bacterium]